MHEDFWQMYLCVHRKRATRILHYIATGFLLFTLILSIITAHLWHLLPGIGVWAILLLISHTVIEDSSPLMKCYPFRCLLCSFRMCFRALTGHLSEDLPACDTPPHNL